MFVLYSLAFKKNYITNIKFMASTGIHLRLCGHNHVIRHMNDWKDGFHMPT